MDSFVCSLCNVYIFVILVIFHFGFEDRILVMIAAVPCYCLIFIQFKRFDTFLNFLFKF